MASSDTNTSAAYVRTEMVPSKAPPASTTGVQGWVIQNLFPNWWNGVLTVIGLFLCYVVLSSVMKFAFFDAVWSGADGSVCRHDNNKGVVPAGEPIGACWAYVKAKFYQFMYYAVPDTAVWQVNLVYVVGLILLVPFAMPSVPYKMINGILLFAVYPIFAGIFLTGSFFGLEQIETTQWGGLLLTLVIGITGIVASLPIGILLALGRRSKMPIVRLFSVIFIEFWRGVPLITVLFMSSVMLPLFLPEGTTIDKVIRPLIGVALFSSAYMAEVVRGGLQAIPKGQYEGAQALGLKYWQMMGLIILPQALKLVIPGIVNTFIGLFKDTSLVSIIGMFDLIGVMGATFSDPKWSSPTQSYTAYLFLAVIYWIFCFGMSRYSIFMENLLHTGHKR